MHWFTDHEAVSALLRVSPNRGDGTPSGAMGDISSRRPTHMAEDAVRAVKLLLMNKMMLLKSAYPFERLPIMHRLHLVAGWRRASACECSSEVRTREHYNFYLTPNFSPADQLQATKEDTWC